MFRAIGVVIILWYMSSLFSQTFTSADSALSASFHLLEATATVSQQRLVK